jgi:FlaA1/EpsC-like NDP-sugar epimerase
MLAALHDSVMAAFSFVLALYLRLGDDQFFLAKPYLVSGTVAFTAICIAVFIAMRLYGGLWRYASLRDLMTLTKAVTLAEILFLCVMFTVTRLDGMPRSLPVINGLILLCLLGGPRFLYRALKDRSLFFNFHADATQQIPVLLSGATSRAEAFIRDTLRNQHSAYRVVGLIDEKRGRHHQSIHGVRIYGGVESLPAIVASLARKDLRPQRLVLSDRDPDGAYTARLLEAAESLGLTLGRLPDMQELKNTIGGAPDIRAIAIEDLLGRPQNIHECNDLRAMVAGKNVAVTGAGGSIGSELVRQLAALNPKEIQLLDQSEFALYEIDREMATLFPALPRQALLFDVRNRQQVEAVFAANKPQLVFHAAAIKHVPLSESNPLEAIATNALGTRNVADAAYANNAQAMVMISTDKAVNPTNVMGASKRLAESYCQALAASRNTPGGMRCFTVRFGNVLGSNGSVVPLFERQLKAGGPITVTHPDMVRYFMTIREAVGLVIQAAALGTSMQDRREAIFVLDMGRPVRITDLAMQMIRLAGLSPMKDIDIVYTGLRPGEKLFEELFYEAEQVTRTTHQSILLANARQTNFTELNAALDTLGAHIARRDKKQGVNGLIALVPEYKREARLDADHAAA